LPTTAVATAIALVAVTCLQPLSPLPLPLLLLATLVAVIIALFVA
jgi:hypothetical protein